jgi:hypothetical protein
MPRHIQTKTRNQNIGSLSNIQHSSSSAVQIPAKSRRRHHRRRHRSLDNKVDYY